MKEWKYIKETNTIKNNDTKEKQKLKTMAPKKW